VLTLSRTFPSSHRPPTSHLSHHPSINLQQLPWSTSNEDLVELFQTTGTVQEAEVLFENGRSKGSGVVQFATVEEAETAIAKFQNYSYGGESSATSRSTKAEQAGPNELEADFACSPVQDVLSRSSSTDAGRTSRLALELLELPLVPLPMRRWMLELGEADRRRRVVATPQNEA
jgi:RNA recognition motif-containing protein